MDKPTIPKNSAEYITDKCSELEKCIAMNKTLHEVRIEYQGKTEVTSTFSNVVRGVTRNNTITSLTLTLVIRSFVIFTPPPPPLPNGVIEQLLKDNNTIQALSLHIDEKSCHHH